jgi:hypothetical protein
MSVYNEAAIHHAVFGCYACMPMTSILPTHTVTLHVNNQAPAPSGDKVCGAKDTDGLNERESSPL